ncbi:hypothetical protein HA402_000584 [Bradysia odoriphaga]|nr:hypothetical protein HA402_000584 [Bradysia odoriphaga]
MDYRSKELSKISENVPMGNVTNINLTIINGGVQINVVPAEIKLSFDIRLAVGVDQDAFEAMIRQWCEEAGGDIDLRHILRDPTAPVSITDDRNPFWVAFKSATDELNLKLKVMASPGCTDARFIRQLNIPAFGFSPMRNTPRTLHDHDEFVYADGYLEGINIYPIELTCNGQSGHGSAPLENTPGEKVSYILNKFMDYRSKELSKISENVPMGNVTNINLTIINGGVQINVVPAEIKLSFDIRLAVGVDQDAFEAMIRQWCEEAGGDIDLRHILRDPTAPVSITDDRNPFWVAFKSATDELNFKLKVMASPGCTDARFIRQLNIPAFGFSPMRNTPRTLHDHDEFVYADGYLEGINIYHIELTCNGQSGHGSAPLKNTPGEKLRYILDKFMDYRSKEITKISENVPIGETTSINLTMINGGVQINVVPAEIKLSFDIRLAVGQDQDAFEAMIRQWCEEAGGDIDLKHIFKDPTAPVSIADERNPFWVAFKSATDELNLKLKVMASPGCTDARFIRQLNIPAFGFSPMRNTPRTLHDHDEFVYADGYLEGINIYHIELTCNGQSGHGSAPLKNTPGEKLRYILDKFMDYRSKEITKISENVPIGETTSINLTMINGGVQINVVPAEIKLSFDIRLAVGVDQDAFEAMIRQWCEEAGGNIDLKHILRDPTAPVSIADDRNPFWVAFKSATDELNLTLQVVACPGCTDARFIRQLNIPAFGFSPMRNTRRTLHDHDEFVYADGYLEGINIYRKIISNIANV